MKIQNVKVTKKAFLPWLFWWRGWWRFLGVFHEVDDSPLVAGVSGIEGQLTVLEVLNSGKTLNAETEMEDKKIQMTLKNFDFRATEVRDPNI